MREGAERGGVENLRWLPILREVLLVEALSEEVADLARAFIRNHRIPPPPSAPAHWPWPLRIRTFGRFSIERDGVPLRFDRKAPHKVLAVLKALIARGGDAVPLARLADDVWPDEDGDAAQHSCVMAIHRLRKLLGERDILVVEDGLVTLDRSRIFVDALELLAAPDRQRNQDELFALYGGDFLPEETDCRWAAAPRERLRGKFVAAISRTGRDLEQGAQFCAAAHLYQRGIDATPLTEELYQGLIRCSVAEQRWADAYASYERLRSVLTTTLTRQPSLATERLLQPLMTGNTRLSLVSAAASSSRAQKSPQK
jgi:DNA-binding SARP family transcriptional activator